MKTLIFVLSTFLSVSAFASDFDTACADAPSSDKCLKLGMDAYVKLSKPGNANKEKDCAQLTKNLTKACEEAKSAACHMVGMCGIFSDKKSEGYKKSKDMLSKSCSLGYKYGCDDLKKYGN